MMVSNEMIGGALKTYSQNIVNFLVENLVFIASFLVCYILISFFILKPYAQKKARESIGGNLKVKSDPLLWVLPLFVFLVFYIFSIISTTNF